MGLPQSTVMSVVQVFKKEHRIHKKTATGRKRRLTTAQEFQLFEMSQERDNISVDEIRTRFLQLFPEFGHISKTTIYRTLERGKVVYIFHYCSSQISDNNSCMECLDHNTEYCVSCRRDS